MLDGRKVLLVVGGGIAAYKAPLLVRALTAEGAQVRCIMTRAAASFVTPMALQAVSHHRVATELLDTAEEAEIGHIELARWPDIILIAPATANLIARLAAGLADDLATTVLLATRAPVVLAPAMNTQMLEHPATRRNLAILEDFGHTLVAPSSGELACREVGAGRQPDPPVLVEHLAMRLCDKPLAGRHLLVTAGPTREYLDPVRFLSNPSTGRMGVAMARAARWLGARVTLVAGPGVTLPPGVELDTVVDVETVEQMASAVLERLTSLDWLIMSAAVGDFTPREPLGQKRKKSVSDQGEGWTLELRRTRDILATACQARAQDREQLGALRIVGFAAETHDLETYARRKLETKGCDAILGNWVRSAHGDAFGSDENTLHAFGHDGFTRRIGPAPKLPLALEALRALIEHLGPGRPTPATP